MAAAGNVQSPGGPFGEAKRARKLARGGLHFSQRARRERFSYFSPLCIPMRFSTLVMYRECPRIRFPRRPQGCKQLSDPLLLVDRLVKTKIPEFTNFLI